MKSGVLWRPSGSPYPAGQIQCRILVEPTVQARWKENRCVDQGVSEMKGSGKVQARWKSCGFIAWCAGVFVLLQISPAAAQERREREPNSVYAERRAKLAAQVDAPIVLWGFTGREESSLRYVFAQEENFYYLTGHNEEGAALLILPASKHGADAGWDGPREILYLPPKDPVKEKWNGVRMSPSDAGIEAQTG